MKRRWRHIAVLAVSPLVLAPLAVSAQGQQSRMNINRSTDPLLSSFQFREIGPIGQGGRVDDIAAVEIDPRTFYVAFATAGVWKTVNNGITFTPIFDTYGVSSVGAVEVSQSSPNIIYVGTGEANNRQSSTYGDGMYKSTDGGATFTHIGLRETQSIARILVHPTNPDIVWVAAVGHLFGPNEERGVFKSTNGGRTWNKVLYVDENTGATEIVMDPSNPNIMFAATYQRRRTGCCFVGGGPGSGIWRSENGGNTWTRMSGNGLPNGTMGRAALAFAPSDPNVMYAQIEVGMDRQQAAAAVATPVANNPGGGGGGRGGQQAAPNPQYNGIWRSNDKGRTWEFRSNENQRPMYFSQIAVHSQDPDVVYVAGVNAMKSTDGARTFRQMPGMGHVDHHAIWVNPRLGDHVMYGNDGSIDVSYDGGAIWESLRGWSVAQTYHVSVDMGRPYRVCTGLQDNGSWCGPSRNRSGNVMSQDWFRVQGSDGFYTAIDPSMPEIIYSESQNGGVQKRNLKTGQSGSIRPNAGGQGRGGGPPQPGNIVPAAPAGTQIRWNWNTPFMLSPHNPAVVLLGGNRFFQSFNRGETWMMSDDHSKNLDRNTMKIMGFDYSLPNCSGNAQAAGRACLPSKGDGTSWAVISTVSESPVQQGVFWTGTDDGNVHVSHDGGKTFEEVGKNIPGGTKEYNISRVEASRFDAATAYVSVDGHRSNDMKPYVYVTRDYGRTWTSLAAGLPAFGNVNSIRQDPVNRNLLYVATENSFFVSLDEGKSWKKFMNGLATVRIDDMLVHPRDADLVLATHGRGIQIMDDVTALQQLTPEVMALDAHLMQPREVVLWKTDTRLSRSVTGSKDWRPNAPPLSGAAISYYLKSAPSGDVSLTITNLATGQVFRTLEPTRNAGLNRVMWNLRGNPPAEQAGGGGGGGGFGGGRGGQGQGPQAEPGSYRVTLSVGGREQSRTITLIEDVWMN